MGACAALLLSAVLAQARPQFVQDRASLEYYAQIVERYRRGELEAALAALGERPDRNLREVVVQVTGALRARRLPAFSVPAAILLHTDRALLERERGQREAEAFQLVLARELAKPLASLPDFGGFGRRYYLAIGQAWQVGEDWGLARELLEAGLEQFPTDPPLLVARAALEEALATFTAAEEPPARPGRPEALRLMSRATAAQQQRLAAADLLRRALALAPDHEVARVRLGHVLLELDRDDEAATELEGLLAVARDVHVRYLALLLRGRAHQRAAQLEAAIERYRAAQELEPRAQVARLALARALDEAGLPGAPEVLAQALARQALDGGVDPWRAYHFPQRDLLADLRREVWR